MGDVPSCPQSSLKGSEMWKDRLGDLRGCPASNAMPWQWVGMGLGRREVV